MKKKTWKLDVKAAFFLIIITSICTLFLSGANAFYQGILAERQKELRMEIFTKFGETFTEENFNKRFADKVEIIEDRKNTYFIYKGTPKQSGILTTGSGRWGAIELLIMINEDNKQIIELQVLHHSETPGLGGKIEEKSFLSQFINLDYSDSIKIVSEKTGEKGEVDAISGATATSNSMETIINTGLQNYFNSVEFR